MKVRIRLQNHGLRKHRYWWMVVQPAKKNPKGKIIEKLGIWAPQKKKTVPRQYSLNLHRAKYWLSVGATATNRVHHIMSKFGLVPRRPHVWGSAHAYEKPEKTYDISHYAGLGKKPMHANQIAFFYKQQLQEQMNIVERKRRLQAEALENMGGSAGEAASALDELESDDTDGYESDEADVFERKKKFEKLLKKVNKHRQETALTLKGNDLRYNVYLRKL